MRVLRTWSESDKRHIKLLIRRSFFDREVQRQVEAIIEDVEKRGDEAISDYSVRFDDVWLGPDEFRVTKEGIARARREVGKEFISAFREVERNVTLYHRKQKPRDWKMKAGDGGIVGERWVPLERVGVYVPGGKAPLVSSLLMGVVPAKVAEVKEIAVFSPPGRDWEVNPFILAACAMLGVEEVYRIGGAQAIAAMALGTQTIRRVDKVIGPGNIYVAMAKKALYGRAGIDIVAGPSEVLVLADETAKPAFVAADLLAQAEHGTGREICMLLTDSMSLAKSVQAELKSLVASAEKKRPGDNRLLAAVFIVVAKDLSEAIQFANNFAAEHVEVITRKPDSIAAQIRNAGAVFIGPYSPVCVGDFYAGPNHVLPTGGTARFLSGLSLLDFMRRVSVVSYTKKSLRTALPAVTKFAEVEGLRRHADAARLRFRKGRG
jgi:histidinol dehydrogenase